MFKETITYNTWYVTSSWLTAHSSQQVSRMYDHPLVGRMLSPDIVIQDPEYSQSYNRYSYCFNNPLRFTAPSGYVVRNIWPNREVEFKFADPSPKRLLYDHKTSIDNFILPKYIESMQFIEFNLKSK